MTFATVSDNRQQLLFLSHLLLSAYPGCTIHQSRDPMRAAQHLSTQDVDAVFADADTCSECICIFNKHKSHPSVYLLCRQELPPPEETEGIHGIVTYPITTQKIQIALQTTPQEVREVV